MSPSLDDLPPEILGIIGDLCVGADRKHAGTLNLRATCRSIEAGTRHSWVSYFFTSRYLDLNPAKLTELRYIASVPELARAVRVIVVHCEDDTILFRQDEQASLRFLELINLSSLMALAFQNLKNLEEIHFEASETDASERAMLNGRHKVIDCSTTLSLVLLNAQLCGLRPTTISNFMNLQDTDFGVTDISSIPQLGELLSGVKRLELQRLGVPPSQNKGSTFAQQLARSLNLMQSLTRLTLCDENRGGFVMHELGSHVYLPFLAKIWLDDIDFRLHDMITFLRKHTKTLKTCEISRIAPMETDAEYVYRILLETLRDSFHLRKLTVGFLFASDGSRVQFPRVDQTFCEDENDDGFVEVFFGDTVLNGQQEIEKGVTEMLSWVSVTPH